MAKTKKQVECNIPGCDHKHSTIILRPGDGALVMRPLKNGRGAHVSLIMPKDADGNPTEIARRLFLSAELHENPLVVSILEDLIMTGIAMEEQEEKKARKAKVSKAAKSARGAVRAVSKLLN